MERLNCDNIKRLITLTGDYIKRHSLYMHFKNLHAPVKPEKKFEALAFGFCVSFLGIRRKKC